MRNSHSTMTLESMSQAVWYNQWTLKKFEKYLKGDILEVGCGIGNFTRDLQKYGVIWAIDINESYVKQTRSKVEEKTRVGLGDIEKGEYFFKGKKFDSIVCLNVLEHIKDDRAALANMYKLLNDGGYLILLIPAFNFLYGEIDKSIGHFRRYNREDLHKIVNKTGFKIMKSRIINFLGGLGWWVSSKVLDSSKVSIGKLTIFNILAPFVLPWENLIEPPIGTSILIVARR